MKAVIQWIWLYSPVYSQASTILDIYNGFRAFKQLLDAERSTIVCPPDSYVKRRKCFTKYYEPATPTKCLKNCEFDQEKQQCKCTHKVKKIFDCKPIEGLDIELSEVKPYRVVSRGDVLWPEVDIEALENDDVMSHPIKFCEGIEVNELVLKCPDGYSIEGKYVENTAKCVKQVYEPAEYSGNRPSGTEEVSRECVRLGENNVTCKVKYVAYADAVLKCPASTYRDTEIYGDTGGDYFQMSETLGRQKYELMCTGYDLLYGRCDTHDDLEGYGWFDTNSGCRKNYYKPPIMGCVRGELDSAPNELRCIITEEFECHATCSATYEYDVKMNICRKRIEAEPSVMACESSIEWTESGNGVKTHPLMNADGDQAFYCAKHHLVIPEWICPPHTDDCIETTYVDGEYECAMGMKMFKEKEPYCYQELSLEKLKEKREQLIKNNTEVDVGSDGEADIENQADDGASGVKKAEGLPPLNENAARLNYGRYIPKRTHYKQIESLKRIARASDNRHYKQYHDTDLLKKWSEDASNFASQHGRSANQMIVSPSWN